MEYDRQQNDEKGLEAATKMRDDYQELAFAIAEAGDDYVPNNYQAAQLLIGATVHVTQLQNQINSLKKALTGYQTIVIPALQEIVDKADSNEMAHTLVNEKFVIFEDNE